MKTEIRTEPKVNNEHRFENIEHGSFWRHIRVWGKMEQNIGGG